MLVSSQWKLVLLERADDDVQNATLLAAPPDRDAPLPAQLPSAILKHPPVKVIPLAKVEVAVPVWLMAKTLSPPANVEVAVEEVALNELAEM